MKISSIFITHLHGDHILGIPGLMQSMNLSGRTEPLAVFGPAGTRDFMQAALALGYFNPDYEIKTCELAPGEAVEVAGLMVKAVAADHTVPAISFIIQDRRAKENSLRRQLKNWAFPKVLFTGSCRTD